MDAGELNANVTWPYWRGTEESGITCEAIADPTGMPEGASRTLSVSEPAKPTPLVNSDMTIRVSNPLTPAVKVCPL
jgi:hypothetical protein